MNNIQLPTISWCITVCTELDEITNLLNFLQPRISPDDEIIIQYDTDVVSDQVMEYLNIMDKMHSNHVIVGFPLRKDFASFKNNLTSMSTKDYIVNLDADEIPHENLVDQLSLILSRNSVDLIFIPRINTVDGIGMNHVKQWNWKISKLESQIGEKEIDTESEEYTLLKHYDLIISETNDKIKYYKPIINWSDYQSRIFRRTNQVKWMGKVHERITGYDNFTNFPALEEWCIYHHKKIDKQEQQNNFYNQF